MHPKDEIGCIGVMAAFYTEKDGSTCAYTNETYHELYDPESFDKNKEFRDIANDGNDELLIQELTKLGVEFRADVKAACPKAKDEHLHGKVFGAQDVKGILMDDQKSLGEVFNIVIDRGVKNGLQSARNAKNMLNPNNNSINMKEKFPTLFAALQVEEMQMSEDGAFLNTGLLETLNAAIEAAQKEAADAKALADQLTAEKEQLIADHQKAIEDLNTEHTDAIAAQTALVEEKQKAIDELNAKVADQEQDITAKEETIGNLMNDVEGQKAQIEQLQADVDGARTSLTTAEQTLAERDQQISDLNAQITELQNDPGAGAQGGEDPKTNGAGAEGPQLVVNQYVYDPALSYEKNRELEKKWNEEHGK
jgi:hypothetical protein